MTELSPVSQTPEQRLDEITKAWLAGGQIYLADVLALYDAQAERIRELEQDAPRSDPALSALRRYAQHRSGCRKGSRAGYQPQATFGADCSCGLDDILYPRGAARGATQEETQP